MTDKPNLTRVWAKTAPGGNVVDPDTVTTGKFAAGWQAEVPPFEYFNFIQKQVTEGLAHINEQGIAVWDDVTTYPVGGLAKGSDGNVYKALVSQSNNDPISDNGTNWVDEINDRVFRAASIAEIEAITAVNKYQVSLSGDSPGIWEFSNANLSTEVTGDPGQLFYIAPDTDDTGASGAWVRLIVSPDTQSTPRYRVSPIVQRACGAAIYTKQNPPSVYDVTSNKTFFTYAGPGREPYAIFYDHTDHFWSQPVRIGDNPILAPFGVEDDHGVPSMAIDNNGFIHILYGSHNTKTSWAKSSSARDISSWGVTVLSYISDMTYAGMALEPSSGDIYSFFRAGSGHGSTYPSHEFGGLMRLPAAATTWVETAGGVIDTTGYPGAATDVYPTDIKHNGGKIYLGWLISDGAAHNEKRQDIHAAYYGPADSLMRSVAGASLGSIVTFSERASVLVHEADYVEGPKLAFGASGRIYAAFCEALPATDNSGHFVSTWNGSAWSLSDTEARTNYYFFGGQIRVKDDETLELFVPVNGDPIDDPEATSQSGTAPINDKIGTGMAVYTAAANGATWSLGKILARKDQIYGQGARALSVPLNSHPGLKCIFCSTEANTATYLAAIYAVTDENYEPLNVTDALSLIPNPHTIYNNYTGTFFVNDEVGGTVWKTVDMSDLVNLNATSIFIEVVVQALGTTSSPIELGVGFRQTGATSRPRDKIMREVVFSGESISQTLEVPLSFDHKFEYKDILDSTASIKLQLVAYSTS